MGRADDDDPCRLHVFRAALDTSSGFQSFQFRELEFLLGNRDGLYLEPFRHEPERFGRLEAALHEPSLYDRVDPTAPPARAARR